VRYSINKWSEFIFNGHSVEPNYLDLAGVGEYEVEGHPRRASLPLLFIY